MAVFCCKIFTTSNNLRQGCILLPFKHLEVVLSSSHLSCKGGNAHSAAWTHPALELSSSVPSWNATVHISQSWTGPQLLQDLSLSPLPFPSTPSKLGKLPHPQRHPTGGSMAAVHVFIIWSSKSHPVTSGGQTGKTDTHRYWRVEDVKHSVNYVWNEVYVALPSSSSGVHTERLLHSEAEKQ